MPKIFKLITCEIFFREICFCLSQTKNIIDVVFMPKGLHDIGEQPMVRRLQEEIDKTDYSRYEAILLGYGLCNNGIRGLFAEIPLVVPRAHDCIALLMGARKKYDEYFNQNPGTYFKSTGWIERDTNLHENEMSITSQLGMNRTYQEYVDQFGEEHARYLMDTLGDWFRNYKKIAYIDTQIGDFTEYKNLTKKMAEEKAWEYDEILGSTVLLMKLLNGEWDNSDFLVVPAGKHIQSAFDHTEIIKC